LSTERSLHYYISDPRSKFQEDRTKIVVAIVDETFCGHTNTHTNTQTNTQVILYLSNAMNCIGQTTMTSMVPTQVYLCRVYCRAMSRQNSAAPSTPHDIPYRALFRQPNGPW